ncbi:MAG: flagellar basal body L-ring protein FlgH [bacterium]|nr:flagellar basal body L-ring protein FlgH [bacterium]
MIRRRCSVGMYLLAVGVAPAAWAQTASLGMRAEQKQNQVQKADDLTAGPAGRAAEYRGNDVVEQNSLIAIKIKPPKEYRVHDLVSIIIRKQKKFEAESELESKKDFDIKSELEAFFKPIDGGLGSTTFYRGKPNVDYKFGTRLKSEGENTREDSFVTRVTAEIIDVKPNGNLVLQARDRFQHEQEVSVVTLTGTCRSTDVTPDNTILSTQIASLDIRVDNRGAVRDAATRGWIPKLLDFAKPF